MSVRRVLLLCAIAGFVGAAPAAADGPLSDAARARAEQAFALGLLHELDAALAGATSESDRAPLLLRDRWWRPTATPDATLPKDPESLAGRRALWGIAGGRGDFPLPRAGERDPYPLLTALVLDRVRRETKGSQRLLEETPLARMPGEGASFVEFVLRPVITGKRPDPGGDPAAKKEVEDARALAAETKATAGRNARLALGAVAGLVLAAAVLFALAKPRRDAIPAAPGGGPAGGGRPPPP